MKFKVGQKLFYVHSSRRQAVGHETEVVKLGRKWTYLSNGERVDADGLADGKDYSSPGTAYLSEEKYRESVDAHEQWIIFKRLSQSYYPPGGITAQDIRSAMALLRLEPPND